MQGLLLFTARPIHMHTGQPLRPSRTQSSVPASYSRHSCPRCAGGSQSHLWAVQRAERRRPGALQRAGILRRRVFVCHLVRAQVERARPPPACRSNRGRWRPLTVAGGGGGGGASARHHEAYQLLAPLVRAAGVALHRVTELFGHAWCRVRGRARVGEGQGPLLGHACHASRRAASRVGPSRRRG